MSSGSVHLTRGPDRAAECETLAAATGGRVGLEGVLADLNRAARPAYAPGTAAAWAFRWDREDSLSARWWPQGITTSADHAPQGSYAGREVVITTSYSKALKGVAKGARITVADVTDRQRVRYRHVLLVHAVLDEAGRADLRPVHAHAGGAVWHGPYLHVAATAKGLYTFHLDDIVAIPVVDRPTLLGRTDEGRLSGFGHRYVLPARTTLSASAAGATALRYSFLSLSHETSEILAGEYGRGDMTTRLVRFPVDPATSLPAADDVGVTVPVFLEHDGVQRMQGAVLAQGRLHVTTSAGRRSRGALWVGPPGGLRRHARALPVGPEDVCYWPARDELWSLTEYPGARLVFTLDRARFA